MEVVSCSKAVSGLGKRRQWEAALQVLEGFEAARGEANVILYSSLGSCFEKAQQWLKAVSLLQKAHAQTIQADSILQNAVISACAKSAWRHASFLLWDMRQQALQATVVSYNSALNSCSKARWATAIFLLSHLRKSWVRASIVTYNSEIAVISQWRMAGRFMNDLRGKHLEPDLFTFNTAMACTAWQQSALLLQNMGLQKLQSDAVTSGAALSSFTWDCGLHLLNGECELNQIGCNAFIANSPWQQAVRLLQRAKMLSLRPSQSTYNALAAGQSWDQAFLTLQHRRSIDLPPDLVTYNSLMARQPHWQTPLKLLRRMPQASLEIDLLSCSSAIGACQWLVAMTLLTRLQAAFLQCDVPLKNSIMSVCQGGSWRMVLATDLGLPLDAVGHNEATVASRGTRWERTLGCLTKALCQHPFGSLLVSQNAALSACELESQWRLAARSLADLEEQNLVSQNAALSAHKEQWRQAASLVNQLSARNLTCSLITYNTLIGACEKDQWRFGVHLLGELGQGMQASVITCSAMAGCAAWRATAALLQEVEPNYLIYSSFVSSLGAANQWRHVLHTLRVEELQSDVASCAVALSCSRHVPGLAQALAARCEALLRRMAHGMAPIRFRQVLQADLPRRLEKGLVAGVPAQDPWNEGLRSNTIILNAALNACVKYRQWSKAGWLLENACSNAVPGDIITHNTMASSPGWCAALQLRDRITLNSQLRFATWRRALVLLQEASQVFLQSDTVTYNTAINACDSWPTASLLLFEASARTLQLDVISCTAAISSDWQRACGLLELLTARALEGNLQTYNSLLGRALELRWLQGLALFAVIASCRLELDIISYNSVAKSGSWELAARYWQQAAQKALSPSHVTSNTLTSKGGWRLALAPWDAVGFGAAIAAARWRRALELLSRLATVACEASAISLGATVDTCAQDGLWKRAQTLLAHPSCSRVQPNTVACNALVNACEKSSQWQGALNILGSFQADVVGFNSAVSACEKSERWHSALWLCWHPSVSADVVTCNAALSACEKRRRWQQALHLHSLVLEPLTTTCNAAISACEKSLGWWRAMSLLGHARKRRVADVLSVSSGIAAARAHWRCACWLLGGPELAMHATHIAYNSATLACLWQGQWQPVLDLMAHALSRQVPVDVATYGEVLRACADGSRWHSLASMLSHVQHQGWHSLVYLAKSD
ncbi:unnamed protein product [Effrenium voratum]|nr:unnamed protein product [Effrenium voratum]